MSLSLKSLFFQRYFLIFKHQPTLEACQKFSLLSNAAFRKEVLHVILGIHLIGPDNVFILRAKDALLEFAVSRNLFLELMLDTQFIDINLINNDKKLPD